ncbi:hypothetical protein C9374_000688 [Naegleria lovaniensis]|uniref:GAIN-B domain-containing protein n=1 Tax=Naegleria lovaniensis TaxID=51637 RepID=A0AA88KNX9_NAELO|nr:uncharacterized protein C9374_000688 [Naegleria lovaniensis]KAG2388524.1 hypothetical protein C9374_000688 [Naegleria lovaniensis]
MTQLFGSVESAGRIQGAESRPFLPLIITQNHFQSSKNIHHDISSSSSSSSSTLNAFPQQHARSPLRPSTHSTTTTTTTTTTTHSEQASTISFSIPSSLTLYSNTPLQIPILLQSTSHSNTKFEYSWKITCCYDGNMMKTTGNMMKTTGNMMKTLVSDQVLVLKSGSSSFIALTEYDSEVIGNFTQFHRRNQRTSTDSLLIQTTNSNSSSIGFLIHLDITGRGDFNVINYQLSKTIDVNFQLLGAHASIKGENQEIIIREGSNTNVTVTPILQNYDRLLKNIEKNFIQCQWTCQYMTTNSQISSYKNCSNFTSFNTFSNSNCQPISLSADKIEEGILTNIDHFLIGITYRYKNLYYIESEQYKITLIPLAFNDSSPTLLSLESNIDMLQYHPPNTPAVLYPVFTQLVYNISQIKTLIFSWENEQTGEFYPFRNLTLSSLQPNTLYSMKCRVGYVGKPALQSTMRFTFRTSNSISKPNFNILTYATVEAFTTRVQVSGNLGNSSRSTNETLCFTQVLAETATYGNVSLTNGGFLCLASSTDSILTLRLPLRRVTSYDTIKLYFMVTDGISTEIVTLTSPSSYSVITNVVEYDKFSQLLLNVFNSQSSSTYENDKPLFPSQLLVAAYMMNDFYTFYGDTIVLSSSDYAIIASTYSTLLTHLGSYCNQQEDSFSENVKCLRFFGAMFTASKLTSTFSEYSSLQHYSTTSSFIFGEIQKFLYNLSVRFYGTILSDYMLNVYWNQVGEKYTGVFFEYIQQAYQAISPTIVSVTFYNNLVVEMNSSTISDSSFKLSQYIINSTDNLSTFSTSFSFMSRVKLDSFMTSTKFSLQDSIQVQLPELSNILKFYSNSDTFIISLQITPSNNNTDSPFENVKVSSKKLQFQIIDPQTNSKIPLVNLTSPIVLKLPILSGVLTDFNATLNASRPITNCVYFDDTRSTWSTDGCLLVNSTWSDFYCACNHTTLFSTLSNVSGNSNSTIPQPEMTFSLIPLIVIASVTGGVILLTLGVATIIQCIVHLYKTTNSLESAEFLLPGEFIPKLQQLSPARNIQAPKDDPSTTTPVDKIRYRDLTFGKKIWECLKEFHPFIGLIFPKRYFKRIHTKRVDRLVIIMVIFITISTTNVLLLSTNNVTAQWSISIPAAIALGVAELCQIPVAICVSVKPIYWKVTGYAYSSLLAFACLILSILGSAGVFTRQKLNMDILHWLYNTLIALAWDLIIVKIVFAACMAFFLEIKITIEVEIEEYRKKKMQQQETTPNQPSSDHRVMITVENNVKIPKLALAGQVSKKPQIPKLDFHGKIAGYTSPKDHINELSSMHASSGRTTATTNTSEMLSGHSKQTPKWMDSNVNSTVIHPNEQTVTTTTITTITTNTMMVSETSKKNEIPLHALSIHLTSEERDISEKLNDLDQQLLKVVHQDYHSSGPLSQCENFTTTTTTTLKTEDCNTQTTTEDLLTSHQHYPMTHSDDCDIPVMVHTETISNEIIQEEPLQKEQVVVMSEMNHDDHRVKDKSTTQRNEESTSCVNDSIQHVVDKEMNASILIVKQLDENHQEEEEHHSLPNDHMDDHGTTTTTTLSSTMIHENPNLEELNIHDKNPHDELNDHEMEAQEKEPVQNNQLLLTESSTIQESFVHHLETFIQSFEQEILKHTRDASPHECFMDLFPHAVTHASHSDVKIQWNNTTCVEIMEKQEIISNETFNKQEDKQNEMKIPKEKYNKDILEYLNEILNDHLSLQAPTSNFNDIMSEIPFEKLQGKTIHEILILISEYESDLILGSLVPPPSLAISSLVKNTSFTKKGIGVTSPLSRVNSPTSPIRSNSKNILTSSSTSSSHLSGSMNSSTTAKVIRGGGINLISSSSSSGLDHSVKNHVNTSGGNSMTSAPTGGYSRSRTSSFYKPYEIEDYMIRAHSEFFTRFRKFIETHSSSLFLMNAQPGSNHMIDVEVKRKKALNELLFLQTVYLHFKLVTVTTEMRKLMANQIISKFLSDERGEYYVNVGFYKRVLSSLTADENLNANSFERACEIVEISLKPLLAAFLNYLCGNLVQEKTTKEHTQATTTDAVTNLESQNDRHSNSKTTNSDESQSMWTV